MCIWDKECLYIVQSMAENEPWGKCIPELCFNAHVHTTHVNVINRWNWKAVMSQAPFRGNRAQGAAAVLLLFPGEKDIACPQDLIYYHVSHFVACCRECCSHSPPPSPWRAECDFHKQSIVCTRLPWISLFICTICDVFDLSLILPYVCAACIYGLILR